MANEQDTIMQTIAQAAVEAARAGVQTLAVAQRHNNDRMQNAVAKIGRPIIHQPKLNW